MGCQANSYDATVVELLRIFVDVLVPVALVVLAGYAAARRWGLDHRPLGTLAYWLLAPAFIFRLLSDPSAFDGPVLAMLASSFSTVLIGWIGMRVFLFRATPDRRVIDTMASTFGNVGNLGFPIVLFALGEAALAPAAIHFLAVTVGSFVMGVSASARLRSRGISQAAVRVVTTPAIAAAPLAFLVAGLDLSVPTVAARSIGLLADAMIPVMLLTLGMQLASSSLSAGWSRIGLITAMKLVVAPLVFVLVASALGLEGMFFDSGLLLAAMPSAVLVGLISVEFDLETEVATAAILATSLLSFPTLALIIRLL